MKNVQVIDAAVNCTYDIYAFEDDVFDKIFPENTDIRFIEDLIEQMGEKEVQLLLNGVWKKRQNKKIITGIHGTLFYGLKEVKKRFYPTNKEDEMIANLD